MDNGVLKTGYEKLDNAIGGLANQDYVALVDYVPNTEISLVAETIINNVAKQTTKKILYFNLKKNKDNSINKDLDTIEIINDTTLTVEKIKSICEDTKEELALVVVDCVQLIKPSSFNVNVMDDMKHASGILKKISKGLNIPVLVLSSSFAGGIKLKDGRFQALRIKENEPLYLDTTKIIFFHRENYSENDYMVKDTELTSPQSSNFFREIEILTTSSRMFIAYVD